MAKKGFDPAQLMESLGWEKGKGLGKSENGMKDPIKVKLKMDSAGVGHDVGEQFTYHWWDHVFNKAAKNIQVSDNQGSVMVEKLGESCEISATRKKTVSKDKSILYGSFVKSATLENGIEEKTQSDSTSEDEDDDLSKGFAGLTDEQLFEACGGRTAHKGARHGLKLNGKLSRIAQQENSSAANSESESTSVCYSQQNPDTVENNATEVVPKKRKKKKSKKSKNAKTKDQEEEKEENIKSPRKETNTCKKKRKRDHKKSDDSPKLENSTCDSISEQIAESTKEHANSCKKKRKKDSQRKESVENDIKEIVKSKKKKKKI